MLMMIFLNSTGKLWLKKKIRECLLNYRKHTKLRSLQPTNYLSQKRKNGKKSLFQLSKILSRNLSFVLTPWDRIESSLKTRRNLFLRQSINLEITGSNLKRPSSKLIVMPSSKKKKAISSVSMRTKSIHKSKKRQLWFKIFFTHLLKMMRKIHRVKLKKMKLIRLSITRDRLQLSPG